eukprot:SAG31_NODE_12130_length_965_cov_1.381062_1_plen_113_part_00
MSHENYVCPYHSGNGGNYTVHNQLKTNINRLAGNSFQDATATSCNLTNKIAMSGDTDGTISTISEPQRSMITDAFDFIKNFVFQNILVTGANGIKSLMSRYCFCIRSTPADV